MINYGGNKVYPAEVERLMRMNGSIVDIEVIGEDDQLFGQKVQAKIKLKENTPFMQNELIAWCHQHISHYKIFSKADFS
jgi:fatty-acyl-CoA synthase